MRKAQALGGPALEAARRESRRHRAAVQRPVAARHQLARLPHTRGNHVLDGRRAAEDHLAVGAVRVQQHEPKRISGVEVPDLVEGEPVEERPAGRVVAEQPDARGSGRSARGRGGFAAVRLREERALDRQRAHAEALDQHLHVRVDRPKLSSLAVSASPPPVGSLLDLSGRVAIVTGASGTIGGGIARRLHEAGAAVVVHGRDEARLEPLLEELGSRGAAAVGDVQREARAICAAAVDSFGRLDVVVNNAGIQPVAPLRSIGDGDLEEMFRINILGVASMTREAAAAMTRGGAIVNIASIEAIQPAFDHSHYAASKAAVVMHTRAAALELGPAGIRVNCVAPGLVEATGIEQSWPEGVARWRAAAPLERLGHPSDVADAVLFLASAAARWITGATLVVDGGVLAHNTW